MLLRESGKVLVLTNPVLAATRLRSGCLVASIGCILCAIVAGCGAGVAVFWVIIDALPFDWAWDLSSRWEVSLYGSDAGWKWAFICVPFHLFVYGFWFAMLFRYVTVQRKTRRCAPWTSWTILVPVIGWYLPFVTLAEAWGWVRRPGNPCRVPLPRMWLLWWSLVVLSWFAPYYAFHRLMIPLVVTGLASTAASIMGVFVIRRVSRELLATGELVAEKPEPLQTVAFDDRLASTKRLATILLPICAIAFFFSFLGLFAGTFLPTLCILGLTGFVWLNWKVESFAIAKLLSPKMLTGKRIHVLAWYLVPIAMLVLPLLMLLRMWDVSANPQHPHTAKRPRTLWFFWGSYLMLLGLFFPLQYGNALSQNRSAFDQGKGLAWIVERLENFGYMTDFPVLEIILLLHVLVSIVCCVTGILFLRLLSRIQEARMAEPDGAEPTRVS